MHAVILTFPGHFLHTILTVRSLQTWYPDIDKWSIVLDDIQAAPWDSYAQDFQEYLQQCFPTIFFDIYRSSDQPRLQHCVTGWWRQQLIKLTLDQILPDHDWFVVDGDIVFHSRCEIQNHLPITYHGDTTGGFAEMSANYVRRLLGIDIGYLELEGKRVNTSPVPFRFLDRDLLQNLRQHVESRFQQEFVDLHLNWFEDQTIVGDIDPPDRMVMTEWELIEIYRRHVQGCMLPMIDAGSGYTFDVDLEDKQDNFVYRHSYLRDSELCQTWWQEQGIPVPDTIWQQSTQWFRARESSRIK
jgi:hypothetical protein